MEYYSAVKGKELLMHDTTWMNFQDILLSKISQSQMNTYYTRLYEVPRMVKFIDTESRMVVTGGWGIAGNEN